MLTRRDAIRSSLAASLAALLPTSLLAAAKKPDGWDNKSDVLGDFKRLRERVEQKTGYDPYRDQLLYYHESIGCRWLTLEEIVEKRIELGYCPS